MDLYFWNCLVTVFWSGPRECMWQTRTLKIASQNKNASCISPLLACCMLTRWWRERWNRERVEMKTGSCRFLCYKAWLCISWCFITIVNYLANFIRKEISFGSVQDLVGPTSLSAFLLTALRCWEASHSKSANICHCAVSKEATRI